MADAAFSLHRDHAGGHACSGAGTDRAVPVAFTIHREANTSPERLGRIAEGIRRLEEPVVFPVHPRTRAALDLAGLELGRIVVRPPLGYLDLTALASQARVILTDSGGLQKEAYWHGVPCVTLRPSTEWVDTVGPGRTCSWTTTRTGSSRR